MTMSRHWHWIAIPGAASAIGPPAHRFHRSLRHRSTADAYRCYQRRAARDAARQLSVGGAPTAATPTLAASSALARRYRPSFAGNPSPEALGSPSPAFTLADAGCCCCKEERKKRRKHESREKKTKRLQRRRKEKRAKKTSDLGRGIGRSFRRRRVRFRLAMIASRPDSDSVKDQPRKGPRTEHGVNIHAQSCVPGGWPEMESNAGTNR